MWRIIIFTMITMQMVSGKLTGDHICQEEERYTMNVTEYFLINSTVRNYKWCMNVPPRCSFYTVKTINDSRIVEKEVTELVDKCCSGYETRKDNDTCVPICENCVNGVCQQGKCNCFPGFAGDNCSIECDSTKWGPNCEFECTCERGNTCHSQKGSCVCPPGWSGSKCQHVCPTGFYGSDCKELCDCEEPDEECHHVTGECAPITMTSTSTEDGPEDYDFDIIEPNLNLDNNTPPPTPTLETPNVKSSWPYESDKSESKNLLPFNNNGKFMPGLTTIEDTTTVISTLPVGHTDHKSETDDLPSSTGTNHKNALSNKDQIIENYRQHPDINNILTNSQQVMKSSKAKADGKEVSVTTTPSSFHDENYLNDQGRAGYDVSDPPGSRSDLVNSAGAAVAIAVAVIVVAVAIVAANRCRKSKKAVKGEGQNGVPTVSVYAHSIFHTPLPEPPIFGNPIFATPIDSHVSNTEGKRFETTVVCSMNFQGHPSVDPQEYLYDHPPSTGSYRAASIPEPPDIDSITSLHTVAHSEPVYDEIPSGMVPTPISQPPPSYKSASLYMNTYGKTRL